MIQKSLITCTILFGMALAYGGCAQSSGPEETLNSSEEKNIDEATTATKKSDGSVPEAAGTPEEKKTGDEAKLLVAPKDCSSPRAMNGSSCGDGCTCFAKVAVETECGDKKENDGDGKVDCDDADCLKTCGGGGGGSGEGGEGLDEQVKKELLGGMKDQLRLGSRDALYHMPDPDPTPDPDDKMPVFDPKDRLIREPKDQLVQEGQVRFKLPLDQQGVVRQDPKGGRLQGYFTDLGGIKKEAPGLDSPAVEREAPVVDTVVESTSNVVIVTDSNPEANRFNVGEIVFSDQDRDGIFTSSVGSYVFVGGLLQNGSFKGVDGKNGMGVRSPVQVEGLRGIENVGKGFGP